MTGTGVTPSGPSNGENRSPAERPHVRLVVDHDTNRSLLAGWLERTGEYVVRDGDVDGRVDLFIVDEAGLRRHRAELLDSKDAESPVYLPCLLVTRRGEQSLVGERDDDLVDDVVELPSAKSVLARRIRILLRVREQSVRIDADRRLLAEQNERLNRFAGRLAHDLRNPLGIAQGYVETARESGDVTDLGHASDALARIHRLVEETLTLAKMGETAIERREASLERVARQGWKHVDTADASLVVEGDCRLAVDESRLLELFENLYRNAVEHAGEDGTVRVGVLSMVSGRSEAGGPGGADAAGFYVEDDGPGIPESDREMVFEVGYTTREEGTGFGLRIVREVCEAHGWDVRVADAANGARFEVTGCDSASTP